MHTGILQAIKVGNLHVAGITSLIMYFLYAFLLVLHHTFCSCYSREEMNENYERAAAIAVFQGHVRRGIVSLKDGAGTAAQRGNAARGGLGLGVMSLLFRRQQLYDTFSI